MKNYDYWTTFSQTGKIDDYLNYIACTSEKSMDECIIIDKDKEGDLRAGINYSDGNGSISHAGWGV